MKEEKQYTVNIHPIDSSERGSHRLRIHFARLVGRAQNNDLEAIAELYELIEARCFVPDGVDYDIGEALDNISGDEFDSLMAAIQGESVGEVNDVS